MCIRDRNKLVLKRDGDEEIYDRLESSGTAEQARFLIDCIKENKPVGLPAAGLEEAVQTMELADLIRGQLRD